jgi:signal transduction histidine kinase
VEILSAIHRRMFLAWGCVIALLVVLSIPFSPEQRPTTSGARDWLLWIAAYVAFLALFWMASGSPTRLLIATQTLIVLGIISTRPALGLEGALFVLVAFQLGAVERPRLALSWIAAQSMALLIILESRFGLDHAVGVFAAYFPFQILAFYTSRVLARESNARELLARVNAELLATRELLAANSRAAERLRISRELHDVFGHRLAALSVNLEVAARVSDSDKPQFIRRAHESAKALLGDVRQVVANLRRDAPVDLRELLQSVISDIPRPAIHLDCDERATTIDPQSAQLLVRCAQEIVTNSIRHSSGENLWLRLRADDGGVAMTAHDDGRSARELREGNGLRGMRERVETAGGSMHVDTTAASGFRLQIFIPGTGP